MENFYHAMLSHHVDTTDSTILSLVQSLFNLRQTIPDRLSLHEFISSSTQELSKQFSPRLARTPSWLARLFDGGQPTKKTPRWQDTFSLFLLQSSDKSPFSRAIPPPDLDRFHTTTCLDIMTKEQRFNIVEFPSSFVPNEKAFDLIASEDSAPLGLRFPSLDRPNLRTRNPRRRSS